MQNKILLCGINAKYIHSNLAIRYLKKYCEALTPEIDIAEFTINDNLGNILKKLYISEADIYGFSCYIWNISIVLSLCASLKKAKPEALIILGGPEVSYDPADVLKKNSFIDYIVAGEGEASLLELLGCLAEGGKSISAIKGIAYREDSNVCVTQARTLIPSLDSLPFPYDSLTGFENKIVYYETSRGCPFNCQYCLSSTTHGVRYLSMDRIKQDIKNFVLSGIRQVKLVDRTFNCNISRSIEIMEYIIQLNSKTNFHFEIAADLINDQFLKVVEKAPSGMFQFEIGVQSTNILTLKEIRRVMDFDKVSYYVQKLLAFENTHIHLDLIAGLPFEDIISFSKSFNDVYSLKPDMLQLGFLKLLKGSGIREKALDYKLEHHDFPPYEVIKTDWLSFKELIILKDIEHVLELYYNSGRFKHSLEFLLSRLNVTPFDFYRSMSDYWNIKDYFSSSKSIGELYSIIKHFALESYEYAFDDKSLCLLNEFLKLDWLLYSRSGNMPSAIIRFEHAPWKEKLQSFLRSNVSEMGFSESLNDMSLRDILKHVGYEVFQQNIFKSSDCSKEMVMFYSLESQAGNKKPLYYTVPFEKII